MVGTLSETRRAEIPRWSALRRPIFIFSFIIVALLATPARAATAAQDSGVQARSEVQYTFGQTMHFSLRVKSDEPIHGATLFFNTPEMDSTFTVDFELDPSREVMLEHELSLTQVQLAPFTTVRYWWRLNTEGGAQTVDEQMLAYVDDRFQWQALSREGIEVYWTGSDNTLGQSGIDVVAAARSKLETLFPADIEPLRIYIYPSVADLRSALRLTGRDWLGAEAMPELGLVLVSAVNPRTAALDLGQTIPHELSHLMLYRTAGVHYESTPRWFDEGLATAMERTPDSSHRAVLEQAVAAETTIPFAELCATFPADDAGARLAYAQSAALVNHIQQNFGAQALRELILAFADGMGCEGGVQHVLGISVDQLEANWLATERPVAPVVRFLRANGVWMALAAGSFLITGLLLIPLRRER